jgi:hypothetical protein
VKFASYLTRRACSRQDDKSLRCHVANFVLKNHSGSLVFTYDDGQRIYFPTNTLPRKIAKFGVEPITKLCLFTFCKLWMLWFSSMAAVGTMALVMVYIREERLQMDSNSSFSRIDAMLMYLLGTMSGQGNFFIT